jgi:uncharacterized protein YbjT (DUF2867 family)
MQHLYPRPLKVIITGTTGMVGEGVMHECLQHPGIAEVLLINRRPSGHAHPKMQEMVHADFHNLLPVADVLQGYDACFFCAGVTSLGKNEADYTRLTFDLTMHVAKTLAERNPGMTFCYVSGAGTDSSERGKLMWARVKGRTENALQRLPFKAVYLFRPGIIIPTKGLKNTLGFYKYLGWLLPLFRLLTPGSISSLREIGLAMIRVALVGYEKRVLEVRDIRVVADS